MPQCAWHKHERGWVGTLSWARCAVWVAHRPTLRVVRTSRHNAAADSSSTRSRLISTLASLPRCVLLARHSPRSLPPLQAHLCRGLPSVRARSPRAATRSSAGRTAPPSPTTRDASSLGNSTSTRTRSTSIRPPIRLSPVHTRVGAGDGAREGGALAASSKVLYATTRDSHHANRAVTRACSTRGTTCWRRARWRWRGCGPSTPGRGIGAERHRMVFARPRAHVRLAIEGGQPNVFRSVKVAQV